MAKKGKNKPNNNRGGGGGGGRAPAPAPSRQQATQAARQAATSGNFTRENAQALRQAGVNQNRIQKIKQSGRAAQQATSGQGQGRYLGYGVTNTGTPGGHSMPGGTDANGRPINPSTASNIYKLDIPFSTAGVNNMWGNPLNNFDTGFQVVGDGVNWQDPERAAELDAKFSNPENINENINRMWAMSSLNPNLSANMAAFVDSGHVESLLTGRAPSEGGVNPAMRQLMTPWAQEYAAVHGQGGTGAGAGGTGGTGGTGGAGAGDTGGGGGGAGKASNKLGQAIRQAGGNGGLSKKEFNSLLESTGKNQGQAVRQLDKINSKLKDKGKGSINLKSGAANMLIRQSNKNRTNLLGRRDFDFGDGRIGQQLGDMSGLNTPINNPNRMMAGGGWTPKGKAFEPEFLTRGIDLTGRGASGKTVRGVGKGFTPKPVTETAPETPIDPGPTTTDEGGGGGGDFGGDFGGGGDQESKSFMNQGGYGDDTSNWATSWRGAKGTRAKAGRRAQGTGSMTNRSTAYGVGVRY